MHVHVYAIFGYNFDNVDILSLSFLLSLSLSLSHRPTMVSLFSPSSSGVMLIEVVLGFFLSNFFSRPRTATIIGYLLVISGIVVALILEGLQVGVAHWSCDLIMQSYIVYRSCIDTYTYMYMYML